VLREDNRAVVRAASAASKAADYILAFQPDAPLPVATISAEVEREAA
jgi:antirestriction protein ArdC